MVRNFEICISGHDIGRSPRVPYRGSLAGAKLHANKEFRGGEPHHYLEIYDTALDELVCRRRMYATRWEDADSSNPITPADHGELQDPSLHRGLSQARI